MADSIPSLRRQLSEAHLRIRELEARPSVPEVVTEFVDVPGKETIKVVTKAVEVEGPSVVRVVKEYVHVPVTETLYVTDPAQEEMIHRLQEKVRELEWQLSSQ